MDSFFVPTTQPRRQEIDLHGHPGEQFLVTHDEIVIIHQPWTVTQRIEEVTRNTTQYSSLQAFFSPGTPSDGTWMRSALDLEQSSISLFDARQVNPEWRQNLDM